MKVSKVIKKNQFFQTVYLQPLSDQIRNEYKTDYFNDNVNDLFLFCIKLPICVLLIPILLSIVIFARLYYLSATCFKTIKSRKNKLYFFLFIPEQIVFINILKYPNRSVQFQHN